VSRQSYSRATKGSTFRNLKDTQPPVHLERCPASDPLWLDVGHPPTLALSSLIDLSFLVMHQLPLNVVAHKPRYLSPSINLFVGQNSTASHFSWVALLPPDLSMSRDTLHWVQHDRGNHIFFDD